MITLPPLSVSDTDATPGGLSVNSTEGGAQDFLNLLAGALVSDNAPADVAVHRDLRADLQPVGQDALLQDITEHTALTDLSDIHTLLNGLALNQTPKTEGNAAKSERPVATPDEDELADISALMAMLPPPSTPAATPAPRALSESSAVLPTGVQLQSGSGNDKPALSLKEAPADTSARPQATIPAQPFTIAQAPAALRVETESTPSPVATPSHAMPLMAATPTPTAAHAAAIATVNAPLGTPDWQQTVSQHITMFTRQGQQTAELRLNPENLGQVQITLKMDDNQAQLQMVSAHSHVRAALEAALPMLRTQLAESGIQLGQSSISSENFAGQQQSSSQQQSARQTPTGGQAEPEDELLAVPASLQSRVSGNRAVDIFA
ncbi:hypothetical protein AC791_14030 [Klebsiella sp. RIT-PI-d]|uniref:flagellar hook-length control protein FliK n=1 Tax=Klebsiella sp. RIT-PI-d TaxID=1681196 RepID=UPI000675FDAC|nr:flagellar hook-length control protein FliK [Klebsiella sp. RIT-PI-d]KNC09745.1 hypothetical protein AC791_14030 [Klebsiella sp. RIT-PI-d]